MMNVVLIKWIIVSITDNKQRKTLLLENHNYSSLDMKYLARQRPPPAPTGVNMFFCVHCGFFMDGPWGKNMTMHLNILLTSEYNMPISSKSAKKKRQKILQ